MASFKDILSKPIAEIKAPPPVPMGTYDWRIVSHEFGESAKKKTPFVRFQVAAISAGEDVDQEALTAFGGIAEAEMKIDFYISEDAAFRLKDFLEKDVGLTGATLEDLIKQTINQTFRGYVTQKPSEDGTKLFSALDKTMKIE